MQNDIPGGLGLSRAVVQGEGIYRSRKCCNLNLVFSSLSLQAVPLFLEVAMVTR